MDEDSRKKAVAGGTLFFLGMAAGYLLRNEISQVFRSSQIKGEQKVEKKMPAEKTVKEEPMKKESEESTVVWTGMTWEKIRNILGSRYPGADVVRIYYALTPEERMEWRKGLKRDALTPLDKAFVYMDSRMLVHQDPTRKELWKALSRYSENVDNFPSLFEEYSQVVREEYGLQL